MGEGRRTHSERGEPQAGGESGLGLRAGHRHRRTQGLAAARARLPLLWRGRGRQPAGEERTDRRAPLPAGDSGRSRRRRPEQKFGWSGRRRERKLSSGGRRRGRREGAAARRLFAARSGAPARLPPARAGRRRPGCTWQRSRRGGGGRAETAAEVAAAGTWRRRGGCCCWRFCWASRGRGRSSACPATSPSARNPRAAPAASCWASAAVASCAPVSATRAAGASTGCTAPATGGCAVSSARRSTATPSPSTKWASVKVRGGRTLPSERRILSLLSFFPFFLPSLPLVPVPGAEPRTAPPCSSAQSCRRLGTGRAPPALRREDASAAPCLLRRCPQRVSPARERSGIETLCAELPASLRVLLCFAVFYPPRSTARASSEPFRLGGEYLKVSPLVLVACSNVRLFQFRSLFSSSLVC